jgi:acyl-CoA synthetase (AMP-forming)/AMP-acid ligase II
VAVYRRYQQDDEDGHFYITDRKKDIIKYKGHSVYPREIKDMLYEHPVVKLWGVIGKTDPIAGDSESICRVKRWSHGDGRGDYEVCERKSCTIQGYERARVPKGASDDAFRQGSQKSATGRKTEDKSLGEGGSCVLFVVPLTHIMLFG